MSEKGKLHNLALENVSVKPEKKVPASVVPIDIIRSETAIRYPIHLLAKSGTEDTAIDFVRKTKAGDIRWKVNSPPGPLSYKIDSLIINRRIDELGWNNIPKALYLGSLSSICRELGKNDSGKSRADVKKALEQGAQASISAKFRFRMRGKTEDGKPRYKWFDSTFSRYAVVFAGQTLPDGKEADGVYILFSEIYLTQILAQAEIRPLNYDYLKILSPASQKFYEVISYRIYAALQEGSREAWINYSEYCLYTAQSRYFNVHQVKAQMRRLHKPHVESGYLEGHPRYIRCLDENQQIDWKMVYTPGPKAYEDFSAFTGSKRKVVSQDAESQAPFLKLVEVKNPEENVAYNILTNIGVADSLAEEFSTKDPQRVIQWYEAYKLGYLNITANLAGYLITILKNPAARLPSEYLSFKASQVEREVQEERLALRESEQQEKEEALENLKNKLQQYLDSISEEEAREFEQLALSQASAGLREYYQRNQETRSQPFEAVRMQILLDFYISRCS